MATVLGVVNYDIISDLMHAMFNTTRTIPKDNIMQIDSRMWDPAWRQQYGSAYNRLFQMFRAFTGFSAANAHSMTSEQSFVWGSRGRGPTDILKKFTEFRPADVADRFMRLYNKLVRIRNGINGELNYQTRMGGLNPRRNLVGLITRLVRDLAEVAGAPFDPDEQAQVAFGQPIFI